MIGYDPRNWFWIVAGDESRAWSSASGTYVSELPPGWFFSIQAAYDAVVSQGANDVLVCSRIASESELSDVLRQHGLTVPAPVLSDYQRAIQAHVDQTANAKGYDSGASCAGYASSSVSSWSSEATAFIAWRDAVWLYVYAQLAAVEAQQRSQPTPSELVAELPAMTWPT